MDLEVNQGAFAESELEEDPFLRKGNTGLAGASRAIGSIARGNAGRAREAAYTSKC